LSDGRSHVCFVTHESSSLYSFQGTRHQALRRAWPHVPEYNAAPRSSILVAIFLKTPAKTEANSSKMAFRKRARRQSNARSVELMRGSFPQS